MNIEAWSRYLSLHQDPHLIQFLRYGFPIGMEGSGNLQRLDIENHSSAKDFPGAVQTYLMKELELGAMLGPFEAVPCSHYHMSLLMSHPKDGTERRIIVDLSYGDADSINGLRPRGIYDGCQFELTLPSLDYLIADILQCREQPKLVKVDIARAFRNVRVDPGGRS